MRNTFYILNTETKESPWYQLRLTETHFCIASGSDLNTLLETIKKYVKKFKTKDALYTYFETTNVNRGHVSLATKESCIEALRKNEDKDFRECILKTVEAAIKENTQEAIENRKINKVKRSIKLTPVINVKAEEAEEKKETPKEIKTHRVVLPRRGLK